MRTLNWTEYFILVSQTFFDFLRQNNLSENKKIFLFTEFFVAVLSNLENSALLMKKSPIYIVYIVFHILESTVQDYSFLQYEAIDSGSYSVFGISKLSFTRSIYTESWRHLLRVEFFSIFILIYILDFFCQNIGREVLWKHLKMEIFSDDIFIRNSELF